MIKTSTRRIFMMQTIALTGAAVLSNTTAHAAMVNEKDPQAMGLGYHADASKIDKAKQPKYSSGQKCENCALYQGKAGDAAAGCPLFPGKQVSNKGWCTAYAKKA